MKGIFFSQIRTGELSQGAVMKVFDEISAFERAGFKMRHVNAEPVSKGFRKTHLGKGICATIPFNYIFSKYLYTRDLDGYDFYYFRFEAADTALTLFLRELKKNNPKAKVIIEFPDFPNTAWLRGIVYLPLLLKDVIARSKYKKWVDRFAVLDPQYKEIYGVKTLTYLNGIDVTRIPARVPVSDIGKDRIDIVGVCTMFPVHGYDRFISSMAKYYEEGNSRRIILHIVGDGPGPDLKKYVELVKQNNLSEYVKFEGRLTGEALFELYNRCDLALEVFAAFRKGIRMSSSLKSREYLAAGLPIITACDIDILMDQDFKYLLQFENNDTLVDLNEVCQFYDRVYTSEPVESVISNIRNFAESHCYYDFTLRNVFNYIKSSEET